jgi:hypothetical protein
MTDAQPDPPETARFWRLNSIAALKMMDDTDERQAQDSDHLAAIKSNKAELSQHQARENAIKTRYTRIYGKKASPCRAPV